jgi:hypothetical protein
MAGSIRAIRRAMVRALAVKGVYGSRNKAARFAATWANAMARRTKASPKRRTWLIERALARHGLRTKQRAVVEG